MLPTMDWRGTTAVEACMRACLDAPHRARQPPHHAWLAVPISAPKAIGMAARCLAAERLILLLHCVRCSRHPLAAGAAAK